MLERVDRILMAVHDRKAAAENFAKLLGAELSRESRSEHLKADGTILALEESEVELDGQRTDQPIHRALG